MILRHIDDKIKAIKIAKTFCRFRSELDEVQSNKWHNENVLKISIQYSSLKLHLMENKLNL